MTINVDRNQRTARRHCNHNRLGEQAHASGSTVASACFCSWKRCIRIEVEVGAQNSGEVFVHHHSAIHLAELKQSICCERNIKFETISARSKDVFCISHANEGAQTASDNHVQCNAKRCTRGSHLQSGGNTVLVFCCAWIKLRWLHGSPSITCSLQAAFCDLVRLRLQFVSTFQVYGFVAGACSDGLEKTGFSLDD